MPKKKTRKAAAKRFKLSAGGKLSFRKPGRGHLLSAKSRKTKRHMRKGGSVPATDLRRIKRLLES